MFEIISLFIILGRDEEEDQLAYHMQERKLSLYSLCSYFPGSRNHRRILVYSVTLIPLDIYHTYKQMNA